METKIYLIRHAETDWNKEKRYQGQKDVPLNETGLSQAEDLAVRLYNNGVHLDAIYSSDLQRANETAKQIANLYNIEVQTNTELRERFFGKLEGLNIEEFKKQNIKIDITTHENLEYFEVESFETLKNRIFNIIKLLCEKHEEESIAIVSHGSSINSFLFEISMGTIGTGLTRIKNVSVTTVIFDHKNKNWQVKDFNNTF